MRRKARVAIVAGDPAGIGPEISLKTVLDPAVRAACNPILIGDPGVLARHVETCGMRTELRVIDRVTDADWQQVNVLACPQPDLHALELGAVPTSKLAARKPERRAHAERVRAAHPTQRQRWRRERKSSRAKAAAAPDACDC